ncbi:MFS transporter [Streptomyces xanthochromogenes]|uniref:MFS transporter n=1 Tax=Streptomyces xanthochromogenes TaxID=67384 RepID=UPI00343696C4
MTNPAGKTFGSLAVPNFRRFVAGQVVSATGTWMMVVAQDWLVLSLSHNDPTALATVTALQFTPLLLLTLYGGRLADRHDKRRLLVAANLTSAGLAAVLAVLAAAGSVRVWHLYGPALALGVVNAVEVPTRMAFVSELVGPELLPNASSLSAAYFNTARIVGPALAGLLIAGLGIAPVFALNAVSYLATVAALLRMDPALLHRGSRAVRQGGTLDGLRYLRARPDLALVLALVAVIGLFGFNFQLTLPLLARTVFHTGASAFGLLTAAVAVGSLAGAFATARRRTRPALRLVVVTALAFGALETAAGLAASYAVAALLLALTGAATTCFTQAANHRIQLGCDPEYRGRVLAVYTLILQGSTPLGVLAVGWFTQALGARAGLWGAGLVCLTATALLPLTARPRRPAPAAPGGDGRHRTSGERHVSQFPVK